MQGLRVKPGGGGGVKAGTFVGFYRRAFAAGEGRIGRLWGQHKVLRSTHIEDEGFLLQDGLAVCKLMF